MIPTWIEIVGMFLGIATWWVVIYSGEKDQFDDLNIKFPMIKWFKVWIAKKNDNILLHFIVSGTSLFIGVHNLQLLMKDNLAIPDGLDEVGASVVIGLIGSFIGGLLKQGAKATGQIRSINELKKDMNLGE
jgi:hypothetical protein